MKSLLGFPCVGCCVLLLGASSTLHLRDVEASVTSVSPDSSGSVRESPVSSESSPLPASAVAVVHGPPSTTGMQPQDLPTAAAVSVTPAPEASTPSKPSRSGPIATVGTLLLSLFPGISWINELFVPRPPRAVETARASLVNETPAGSTEPPAVGDTALETDGALPDAGATLSTPKPSVALVAASTESPPAASGRGSGTPGLRVRRLQNGRHNLPTAARRDEEDQTVEYKRRTGHDGENPRSNGDAEEIDDEESSLAKKAEMKSEDLSTNEDSELVKSEPHITAEHKNDGSGLVDDAPSEVQETSNETQESADASRSAGSTSSAAEKGRRHYEKTTGVTRTTDESKSGNGHSDEEAAASPLPIAQISQQISTKILSSRKKADLAGESAPSSPLRNARPRMPYYGGGPTFFPPTAFGPMPMQTAAVAPITVVVPPAPVQMMQAAPVQMIQAAPVQMIQAAPVQMVQAAPMQMIPTTPVQMVQPTAVTVQAAVPVEIATTPVAAVSPAVTIVDTPVVAAPAVAAAPTVAVATPMINPAANTTPILAAAPTAATVI